MCRWKRWALEVSVEGGKQPFTYKWSHGDSKNSISGLAAGKYSITITDAFGTTADKETSIPEPKPITLSASVKSPASTNNSDGKATAKANGGTGDLTYQWSNGESGKDAVKLPPGEHNVVVTDENGCSATATVNIQETYWHWLPPFLKQAI